MASFGRALRVLSDLPLVHKHLAATGQFEMLPLLGGWDGSAEMLAGLGCDVLFLGAHVRSVFPKPQLNLTRPGCS